MGARRARGAQRSAKGSMVSFAECHGAILVPQYQLWISHSSVVGRHGEGRDGMRSAESRTQWVRAWRLALQLIPLNSVGAENVHHGHQRKCSHHLGHFIIDLFSLLSILCFTGYINKIIQTKKNNRLNCVVFRNSEMDFILSNPSYPAPPHPLDLHSLSGQLCHCNVNQHPRTRGKSLDALNYPLSCGFSHCHGAF